MGITLSAVERWRVYPWWADERHRKVGTSPILLAHNVKFNDMDYEDNWDVSTCRPQLLHATWRVARQRLLCHNRPIIKWAFLRKNQRNSSEEIQIENLRTFTSEEDWMKDWRKYEDRIISREFLWSAYDSSMVVVGESQVVCGFCV